MDLLLPALLALPFGVAAVIVAVSFVRRRRQSQAEQTAEPAHRAQAGTAAVQGAADHTLVAGRRVRGGRERRASSGATPGSESG